MTDGIHRRVVESAEDPRRLTILRQVEMGMDRGNAVVELESKVGVIVEIAVGVDVELAAEKEANVGVFALKVTDAIAVLEHHVPRRPIDGQVLAVVGERYVFISPHHRRFDHLLQRRAAIPGPV